MTNLDQHNSSDTTSVPPLSSQVLRRRRFTKRTSIRTPCTGIVLLGMYCYSCCLVFPSICSSFVPKTTIASKTLHHDEVQSQNSKTLLSMGRGNNRNNNRHHMNDQFYDVDMMEMMVGGLRYENVPLPDSMLDTTLFVGNLCEFAKDEDLSNIFKAVTNLKSLPACVARRPNYQSLQYGFVAFPTVEEKEAAILRFHGREFMGRRLKVEEILDHPSKGRVNVPEKLVSYVLGRAKKIPRGKNDFSLRKISNPTKNKQQRRNFKQDSNENSLSRNQSSYQSNGSSSSSGGGKSQGRRKGDRKQSRANHKRRRRRNREQDFFY